MTRPRGFHLVQEVQHRPKVRDKSRTSSVSKKRIWIPDICILGLLLPCLLSLPDIRHWNSPGNNNGSFNECHCMTHYISVLHLFSILRKVPTIGPGGPGGPDGPCSAEVQVRVNNNISFFISLFDLLVIKPDLWRQQLSNKIKMFQKLIVSTVKEWSRKKKNWID